MRIANLYTPKMYRTNADTNIRNPYNNAIQRDTFNSAKVAFKGVDDDNISEEDVCLKPCNTIFFPDFVTLEKSTEIIQKNFKNGATILDFACSKGEEAISIMALLRNNIDKYSIKGIDINNSIISQALTCPYTLLKKPEESYLQNCENSNNDKRIELFYEVMEELENNLDDETKKMLENLGVKVQKKYGLKPEYKNKIDFQTGDITNIADIETEKETGAIFFRNAFYQFIGDFPRNERTEACNTLVSSLYDKLADGGIFVAGNAAVEWADFNDTGEETFKLPNGKTIKTKSTLEKALIKHGGFEPLFYSDNFLGEKTFSKVPTIWQKKDIK